MSSPSTPMPAPSKYKTVPDVSDKMPRCIPFIVVNECAERFSFYGMTAILAIFLTKYLRDSSGALHPLDEGKANDINHYFNTVVYFTPLLGSLLADIFWGKYRTIFWVSLLYCVGHAFMSAGQTLPFALAGMALIALGAGGIKPCVSANVGDQFGPKNQHLLAKVYSWFYFAINIGAFFSTMIVPWVLENYGHGKRHDALGPQIAFAIPGVLMAVAAFVFWMGRRQYVHVPPAGWSKVRDNFTGDNLKILLKLAFLFLLVSPFYTLYYQSFSEWVLQADKSDLSYNIFGWKGYWVASQIQSVNSFLILVFTPIFAYVVYPFVGKFIKLTPQRKMVGGMIAMLITFLPIVYIQKQLDALHTPEHQKAATVASFQPGDAASDAKYQYQHADGAETAQDAGRQGLRSSSWFSYEVPVDAAHPVAIQVTYRNSEAENRHFKIRAGSEVVKDSDGKEHVGEEIGDESVSKAPKEVNDDNPVNFYTAEYIVPEQLVTGKKSIPIRFEADKDTKDETKPSSIAAVYEIASVQNERPSYWWQVLAYALITAAEVMVSIPILEFAYTHAPKKMKSLVMAFYFACSISAGNFILNQLSGILKHGFAATFFAKDPSKAALPLIPVTNFYWFYIVYLAVMTVVFVVVSRMIHLKSTLGGDMDVKAETETPRGEPLAPSSEH